MKALKLSLFVLVALFGYQSTHAQTIVNNSDCAYNVKAHYVPSTTCSITGTGPFYTVAPHSTISLPAPPSSDWILGFSVRKATGGPLRTVGDCSLPKVQPVGFCLGSVAKAYYKGAGNLEID